MRVALKEVVCTCNHHEKPMRSADAEPDTKDAQRKEQPFLYWVPCHTFVDVPNQHPTTARHERSSYNRRIQIIEKQHFFFIQQLVNKNVLHTFSYGRKKNRKGKKKDSGSRYSFFFFSRSHSHQLALPQNNYKKNENKLFSIFAAHGNLLTPAHLASPFATSGTTNSLTMVQ